MSDLGCKQKSFQLSWQNIFLSLNSQVSNIFVTSLHLSPPVLLWIKTNVRRTAFGAVQYMHIFLGCCISPRDSEQNSPTTLLLQQRPRDDREQRLLEDRQKLAGSNHRFLGRATALGELLCLSLISLPIRLKKSVQQLCYYCQFCSLSHHFWTTERLKY